MSTASTTASTANPTRGRWGLVVAALLMQLSLGAVYAWSVFSSALQKAEAFKLTKPEATLPFEVAKPDTKKPDADLEGDEEEDIASITGEDEEPSADDEVDLGGDDDLGVETPQDEH